MKSIDILDVLPDLLAARLESNKFFRDIPIVVAVKGNVAAEYQRKQAVITAKSGRRGICVVVLQIVADDLWPGQPGAPMKLKPAFQVVENVELNNDDLGTKKSARKVARKIVDDMKGLLMIEGVIQAMKPVVPCIEPVDIKELGPGTVSEQVNFECQEFFGEPVIYAAPPVYSGEGTSQLVMTSATEGAAIWYTTDGSWPYPGVAGQFANSTAQLYAGPITMPTGHAIVSAAAYLDDEDSIASPTVRKTIITAPQS